MFRTSMALLPLLATDTNMEALNELFTNESQLEIWAPNFLDQDKFAKLLQKGLCQGQLEVSQISWDG